MDPPRERTREIRPLDERQVKRLLKAVEGDNLEALYFLAVTTGMRSGELLGLRWEDINLESGTLQVRRTVFNGRIEAPKTLKAKRSIKLSRLSLRALRKQQRVGEWLLARSREQPPSFKSRSHRPQHTLGAGIRACSALFLAFVSASGLQESNEI